MATVAHNANDSILRRPLAPSYNTFPSSEFEDTFTRHSTSPFHIPLPQRRPYSTANRSARSGLPARARGPSMQTSPRSFTPMPSFGSVFGDEAHKPHHARLSEAENTSAHGSVGRPASSGNFHSGAPFSSFHIHHDSRDSTSTTSSDSSPTTTISTMDSSSVTDPSPGPSPESPIAKTASTSFVADFRSRRIDNGSHEASPNTFFELQRPTTPAKKPRNLKNLGINTSSSLGNLRTNPTATLPLVEKKEKNSSAPPSPLFIKPPTPPKRRPSNLSLTITTPGSNENKPVRLLIPSTPSLTRPTLRHFQSSPQLPLCSPCVGPDGGMQLPSLRPIKTAQPQLAEVPYEMEEEEDQEPNFDIPQSREEKPAAYPNGPIQIYPSGVFLYFEPTAEQACTFDVIINVASEVKNPFTAPPLESQKDLDARRVDGPPAENPDFACLPDRANNHDSSPSTPKATPVLQTTTQPNEHVIDGKVYKAPEYIHLPWEHNTDIVPDLYKLVKTMDDRVQQGKRVLVHCQCGVSRSASLILAYGLYKNSGLSVQETYDNVKKRSKWIGPNMNLIMQLQEFRNGLLKANESRPFNQTFGRRSAGLPTGVSAAPNRHSPFEKDMSSVPKTPRTAPLPPDDMTMQRASTGNMMLISPGPLSAPSGSSHFSPGSRQSWAAGETDFNLSPKASSSATSYVDPKGHLVPVLSITDNDRLASPSEVPSNEDNPSHEAEASLKPLPVANYSRQLPFRSNSESDRPKTSSDSNELYAPSQPLGPAPLRSPAVSSFALRSLAPEPSMSLPPVSPIKPGFNTNPWSQSYDLEPQTSSKEEGLKHTFSLAPSRSTEFYISPQLSPRASTFTSDVPRTVSRSATDHGTSPTLDVASPTQIGFPADAFGRTDDVSDNDLTSPRATEFHMTPLKLRLEDQDPFGLTSPTRFDFPSDLHKRTNVTPPRNVESELRRPSFQAILPPSHLEQPEAVNGFASLNGTAQAPVSASASPPSNPEPQQTADPNGRNDSASTSTRPQVTVPNNESPVGPVAMPEVLSVTPQHREHLFLSTPSRQPGLRTRFSSPNMREQRRLHKLQTEMESMLPNRSPQQPQAVDDLDALMSPRAEEFTRNPFHFVFQPAADDTSPASSNETAKDGQTPTNWTEKRQWTPEKALDEDPRSPVQTGSNPIVRNIWDVL